MKTSGAAFFIEDGKEELTVVQGTVLDGVVEFRDLGSIMLCKRRWYDNEEKTVLAMDQTFSVRRRRSLQTASPTAP